MLRPDDRERLAELLPVLRRAVSLDPRSLARVKIAEPVASVLVRLPFGVLVSRTVALLALPGLPAVPARPEPLDVAVRAAEIIAWLDDAAEPPTVRDADWRTGLPPATGWSRIETVPDDVVRGLVRHGALALREAAVREGVPDAQPRREVADALLDATVLTVDDDAGTSAEVTLRALSALTRMGFLPIGGKIHVDLAGRWIRVVAEHGTVYLERPGAGLLLA